MEICTLWVDSKARGREGQRRLERRDLSLRTGWEDTRTEVPNSIKGSKPGVSMWFLVPGLYDQSLLCDTIPHLRQGNNDRPK